MRIRPLSHLNDREFSRSLKAAVAEQRANLAALLATMAEVDGRRLYLSRGFVSMEAYCLHMRMDEDEVPNRVLAARVARRFPAIFPAIAEGRLHVEAVVLLAPHLTPENADELIAAATHRTETEIRDLLLARGFRRPEEEPPAAG